jgi:hypothetical protein
LAIKRILDAMAAIIRSRISTNLRRYDVFARRGGIAVDRLFSMRVGGVIE